jgi:glycosyltransferase involved in cell wall biosynthesis
VSIIKPHVSVIIPTYNRSSLLFEAVKSVLSQTYDNFELIIVDDGSTDSSKSSIAPLLKNTPRSTTYLESKNRGVSTARNLGAQHAQGEWLAFLDSDDRWTPEKLQLQMEYLKSNPECRVVHGEEIWIRNGRRVNQKIKHAKSGGRIFTDCLKLCLISPSTVVLAKELYHEMQGFDPSFPVCEDYDLWLKITSKYEVGFITTPVTIKYGGHSDQLSRRYFAMDYWRIKSMHRLHSTRKLNAQERAALNLEIITKGEVLVKGYKKHNNTSNLAEVESIINFAQRRLEVEGENRCRPLPI